MNDVVIVEQEQAPSQTDTVLAVISRAATDEKVDIEKMERLLDMQERVMAKAAEAAFNRDMALLQSEMPTVAKEGKIEVNGQVRSTYAKFEDIVAATKPLLSQYGFSITFKSDIEGQVLTVTGTISHREGHSETTALPLPFDDSGVKNRVQQLGSSISYGKRYVFGMLTNVVTGDDDDGVAADPDNTPEKMIQRLLKHQDVLRENFASVMSITESLAVEDYSTAAEAWDELEEEEQRALWIATSKGGIFTTKERDQIRSPEFKAARGG